MSEHICSTCGGKSMDPKCTACGGTGLDTHCTDVPVCPWCGEEMSIDDLHPGCVVFCDDCGKEVGIDIDYAPYYYTNRVEGTES